MLQRLRLGLEIFTKQYIIQFARFSGHRSDIHSNVLMLFLVFIILGFRPSDLHVLSCASSDVPMTIGIGKGIL